MKNIISKQQKQQQAHKKMFNKLKQTYIYVRLMNIQQKKSLTGDIQYSLSSKKIALKFQLSNKTCNTQFETDSNGRIPKQKFERLQDQTHLFCYEGQEMLNIELVCRQIPAKANIHKSKTVQNGYSRIVISPFVVLPHTRHCVDVHVMESDSFQKISNKVIAVMKLQVFYLLKFQGELIIYPYQGNMQRSLLLGELRLCCIFQMNNQRQKSIIDKQGGVHPKWHQFARSIDPKKQSNLQKQKKKQESNILKFKMDSVGHVLKLDVVNFPQLDKDAEIVGSAQINISSVDYLRIAEIKNNNIFDPKTSQTLKRIKLHYVDPVTKVSSEAGEVWIEVGFNFDAKAIRGQIDSQSDSEN